MPELPEVETVVRGLRERLSGARLRRVDLLWRSSPETARSAPWRGDPLRFLELEGEYVVGVERAGKYIVIGFPGRSLVVHLGMTGKLLLLEGGVEPAPHTHAVFHWEDGRVLHFRDPRRFGRIALVEEGAPLGVTSGSEPLQIEEDAFVNLFYGRNAPIKNALLNQKLLRGIGNIYADESLFRSGIDPRASRLSRPRLRILRRAIIRVLRAAIRAGGSSVSDYVASDGRRGWFQVRHRVYARTGLPCPHCRRPIRRIVLAGRSAHFCPSCQRR